MKRLFPVVMLPFASCVHLSKNVLTLLGACLVLLGELPSIGAQETEETYLGPESVETIRLESLDVLYRIGDPEGPGMLEQGTAVTMAAVPAGGLLIFTSYSADGPIQYFRDGRIFRTVGRKGDGPGEYRQIHGLYVDPRTGNIWARDRMRMVSFSPEGDPGEVIQMLHAGPGSTEALFLPDGSLLCAGPGGTRGSLGFLLHNYDFDTQTWTSHYPLFRDREFVPTLDHRKWRRRLALSPEGKVISVTDGYTIEIFDPTREFTMEARIVRRPEGWPEDILEDDARRQRENPFQPGYAVADAGMDTEGRLWVVSVMPEENWEQDLGDSPNHLFGKTFTSDDRGMDVLVEVFDVSRKTLLASFQLDPLIRAIVGPGMLAYYTGDLPYPQYEIIRISLDKEWQK